MDPTDGRISFTLYESDAEATETNPSGCEPDGTDDDNNRDDDDGIQVTIGPITWGHLPKTATPETDGERLIDVQLESELNRLVAVTMRPGNLSRCIAAECGNTPLLIPHQMAISARMASALWGFARSYEAATLQYGDCFMQQIGLGSWYADGYPVAGTTVAVFGSKYQRSSFLSAGPAGSTGPVVNSVYRHVDFAVIILRNGAIVDHAIHKRYSNVSACLARHCPDRVYYNARLGDSLDLFMRYEYQPFYTALAGRLCPLVLPHYPDCPVTVSLCKTFDFMCAFCQCLRNIHSLARQPLRRQPPPYQHYQKPTVGNQPSPQNHLNRPRQPVQSQQPQRRPPPKRTSPTAMAEGEETIRRRPPTMAAHPRDRSPYRAPPASPLRRSDPPPREKILSGRRSVRSVRATRTGHQRQSAVTGRTGRSRRSPSVDGGIAWGRTRHRPHPDSGRIGRTVRSRTSSTSSSSGSDRVDQTDRRPRIASVIVVPPATEPITGLPHRRRRRNRRRGGRRRSSLLRGKLRRTR